MNIFNKMKNKVSQPLHYNPDRKLNIPSGKIIILESPEVEFSDPDTIYKEELDYLKEVKGREENLKTNFWLSHGAARIKLEEIGTSIFTVGYRVIFKDSSIYDIETAQKEINYSSDETFIGEFKANTDSVYAMDLNVFYNKTQSYWKNKNKTLDEIIKNLTQNYFIIDVDSGYYSVEVLNTSRKSVRDHYGLLRKVS